MSLDQYSVLDNISDNLSPVMRRLSDIQSKISGTNTQLLRITRVVTPYYKQKNNIQSMSVLGDFKEKYESHLLANVQIKYPFNQIEFFQSKDKTTGSVPLTGIDIQDILPPIEAEIRFEGDYTEDPINIAKGDKLVDLFYDNKLNAMTIILTVEKFLGNFFGKNIVSKKCNLSLHRGSLDKEIQPIVNQYVENSISTKRLIRSRRF